MRFAQTFLLYSLRRRCRILCLALMGILLIGGCAGPSAPIQQAALSAHLKVINLTDYTWRIAVSRNAGEPVSDFEVKPRATVTTDLTGGDYVIEQSALSEGKPLELSRRIPTHLESGQTYRWRLVTLLSDFPVENGNP